MGCEALHEIAHWYAIHTRSKQEDRTDLNLRAWQIETFTPKLKDRGTSACGDHYSSKPLFTRYIFAHFDANRLLNRINYARGVKSVVSFGGSPAPIDDKVIDFIKAHVGEDGFVRLTEELEPGDKITIDSGPLRDVVGIFQEKTKDSDRVRILLHTVKYQSHLLIDREMIRKIN